MKEGYRLLGDFIRQVDVRNTDGKEENLFGVSVQKMFIPSIANTIGTDLSLIHISPEEDIRKFITKLDLHPENDSCEYFTHCLLYTSRCV